ncbi:tetratricopeptide repeat protein [Actinorhabdospora filicis]|uniref:tetratricopeptide repeat protein n=1 Tax=Actinorhabdospora filicis TaxID=1785913 RepID=UPI0025558751|nr:tetratricopeptide repeat protein [Actinorhabdospora filicis]
MEPLQGKGNGPVRLAGTPAEEVFRNAPVTVAQLHLRLAREKGDVVGEVKALAFLSRSLLKIGQPGEALTSAQQASALAPRAGDQAAQAEALNALGTALAAHRRGDEAIAVLGQAIELFRRVGDGKQEAMALSDLCVQLLAANRHPEAVNVAQAAMPLVEHDPDQRAVALFNLGTALYGGRRYGEAVPVLQRAAQDWRALLAAHPDGDRDFFVSGEARMLARLGACLSGLGRVEEAVAAHRRAASLFDECGVYDEKARSMLEIGVALLGRDDVDPAIAALQEASADYADLGDARSELYARLNLASALSLVKRHQEAVDAGTRALELARSTDERSLMATALFDLAKSQMMVPGRMPDAVVCLEQALPIYQSLGDREKEVFTIYLLGAVLTDLDRAEEGVRHSQRAAELFAAMGNAGGEAGARRNLQIGLGKLNRR